ncbi:MAG: hypothetical protein EOO61_17185 [Hymenobacter sp.]|nr:MAG: hypothetical protein EOO61_17185 [Hymenobacter sp.]
MFVTFGDDAPPDYNYFDDVFRFVNEDLEQMLRSHDATQKHPYMFSTRELHYICFKMRAEYGLFRHHYKDYAIPAAKAMAERLERDYQLVKDQYHDFIQSSGYFDLLMKDVIQAGYVTINHKLESFVMFLTAHARGKAHGPMQANDHRVAFYEELLRDRYDILFDDFLGKEPVTPTLCDECGKTIPPKKASVTPRLVLYPRIQQIRLVANRVKHQSGYPKSGKDPLIDSLSQEVGKPIRVPVDEFLLDMAYADAYLLMLTSLVSSAYMVAMVEHVLSKPPKPGQDEARGNIEALAKNYEAKLELDVQQYKTLRIDKINFVL